jgi:hypothetical protein
MIVNSKSHLSALLPLLLHRLWHLTEIIAMSVGQRSLATMAELHPTPDNLLKENDSPRQRHTLKRVRFLMKVYVNLAVLC